MSEEFGPVLNVNVRPGLITILIMLAGISVPLGLLLARPVTVPSTEITVASKRTKDLAIAIISRDGRLKGGENSLCVVFQKRGTQDPVDVGNVSVDFTLVVGRIQEEPIKAQITKDQVGRYCGQVNLGKQYYVPATCYAFVRYTSGAGKKKKQRLFLSVK